ncbi:hypothetical protein [Actinoplanes sp. NPDC049802]|uniref:hypothetical protein n=1 Tax=Actinoplanes sp. NPDC049802 TaxID=3154742 RepID=UPI00340FE39F
MDGADARVVEAAVHPHPETPTGYVLQVRRLAPESLLGREEELAELARFCTEDEVACHYRWYEADAWAGKTAFLSHFVTNPPPGTRVVSFFITAPLGGQSNRHAFRDTVMEQLAVLLRRSSQAWPPETTRDVHLLSMLVEAAAQCRRNGTRLVLVVDGLDEDTTVGGHGIAGLLPVDSLDAADAGLRIVVAGRPGRAGESDPHTAHPPRNRDNVLSLTASPHAAVMREVAERDLKACLNGDPLIRAVLELITAAGGGLSEEELAELTGRPPTEIVDHLRTVAGRTFARRPSGWPSSREVYVLCHDGIRGLAESRIGEDRLEASRDRLHEWADEYRDKRWPEETPEYLLRQYLHLLAARGDVDRLFALAIDPKRPERMRIRSGSDSAALNEIAIAHSIVAEEWKPDLLPLGRLSMHRGELTSRNCAIPAGLIAVWVRLGQPARAESLARGVVGAARQGRALVTLAGAVATSGDLDEAERIALGVKQPHRDADALCAVAVAMATSGAVDRAEALTGAIRDSYDRAVVLAAVAEAVAAGGDLDRAATIARGVTHRYQRVRALAAVATAGAARDIERAGLLAAEARTTAEQIANKPGQSAQALVAVVGAVAATGGVSRAVEIAGTVAVAHRRAEALITIAAVAAAVGDIERARGLAGDAAEIAVAVPDKGRRTQTLIAVAAAMATFGDIDRAVEIAGTVTSPHRRAEALTAVATATAAGGDTGRARAILPTDVDRTRRERALAAVATAAATAGDIDGADAIARAVTVPAQRAEALAAVAGALAAEGHGQRALEVAVDAENAARSTTDPVQRIPALLALSTASAAAGDPATATLIADRVRSLTRDVDDANQRARTLVAVARAMAAAGKTDGAKAIAEGFRRPVQHAHALIAITEALAGAGRTDEAARTAADAEAAAHDIEDPDQRADALVELVRVVAFAGGTDEARRIGGTISGPHQRVEALAAVAEALAGARRGVEAEALAGARRGVEAEGLAGACRGVEAEGLAAGAARLAAEGARLADEAARLADEAEVAADTITDPERQDRALIAAARARAAAGDLERAENIARRCPNQQRLALRVAAAAAAGAGHVEWAETTVGTGQRPEQRDLGRVEVAAGAAAARHLKPAENIAESVTDPELKAQALVAVARHSDDEKFFTLVIKALEIGSWLAPLPVLAEKQPAVVAGLVAEYWRLWHA